MPDKPKKYREYVANFSKKIKKAIKELEYDRMYWQAIIKKMQKINR